MVQETLISSTGVDRKYNWKILSHGMKCMICLVYGMSIHKYLNKLHARTSKWKLPQQNAEQLPPQEISCIHILAESQLLQKTGKLLHLVRRGRLLPLDSRQELLHLGLHLLHTRRHARRVRVSGSCGLDGLRTLPPLRLMMQHRGRLKEAELGGEGTGIELTRTHA